MSKREIIAWYISDHGYGHAARSIALIREILKTRETIYFIINCDLPYDFVNISLREYRHRLIMRRVRNDVGPIINEDSLVLDIAQTIRRARQFTDSWDNYIARELEFYRGQGVQLVVSDIAPQPFLIAKHLGIPSVGISNFTWYGIYKTLLPAALLGRFREAYTQCSRFIALEFFKDEGLYFKCFSNHGLFCRIVDPAEVARIRRLIPKNHMLVFVTLGQSINALPEGLINFPSDCITWLFSCNAPDLGVSNSLRIPRTYVETQNYVAACDLVVTKPGWGLTSECLINKVPLWLLPRKGVLEDQHTVDHLKMSYAGVFRVLKSHDPIRVTEEDVLPMKGSFRNFSINNTMNLRAVVNDILDML